MDDLRILWVLGIGLGLGCALGYLAHRLKLSPILGYLIAGYLIGPNSPGFIADQSLSDQLANIGLTLLMFTVGLNINWSDITSFKSLVLPGAATLSVISIFAGMVLSSSLGEPLSAGFVTGIAICVSSTVVIMRVLSDQHLLQKKQGHLVVGWTIVEDLVSVFGLVLLPALVVSNVALAPGTIAISVATVLGKIALLALLVYFVGARLIEMTLRVVARERSHELFTIAILAFVFLIAVISSYFFSISLALGAFIAGLVIGKTPLSHQAAANALPMRDAFAVLFFLSIGMLFNPKAVEGNLPLFFGLLGIILLLRPFIAFCIAKIGKYPTFMATTLALSICQIGEYSFILAREGSYLKILPENVYDILIACAFITIALSPILFQIFKPLIQERKESGAPLDPVEAISSLLPKALVIGYGTVGRAAAQSLAENHDVLVIDQNIDTVTHAKEKNIKMLFGDATQAHLLERAHLENVRLIAITTPDGATNQSIIKLVQQVNPNVEIIARVRLLNEANQLKDETIPTVCDEEMAAEKMVALIRSSEPPHE